MASSKKEMTPEEWGMLRDVGQMFLELREEFGLSQKEAAAGLGTAQCRITPLERGQQDVYLTTLSRWANFYGHELQISLVPIEDEFTKALREAAEAIAGDKGEQDGDLG